MKRTITILTTTVILLSTASPLMSKAVSADQLPQTSDTHTSDVILEKWTAF